MWRNNHRWQLHQGIKLIHRQILPLVQSWRDRGRPEGGTKVNCDAIQHRQQWENLKMRCLLPIIFVSTVHVKVIFRKRALVWFEATNLHLFRPRESGCWTSSKVLLNRFQYWLLLKLMIKKRQKRQRPERKFNIVMSGQCHTLAMFLSGTLQKFQLLQLLTLYVWYTLYIPF